jgi:hypothetical protein
MSPFRGREYRKKEMAQRAYDNKDNTENGVIKSFEGVPIETDIRGDSVNGAEYDKHHKEGLFLIAVEHARHEMNKEQAQQGHK